MKRTLLSVFAFLLMLALSIGLAAPALALGSAPVAENLELKTYRSVSVGGTLSAYDPEGDVARFEITTQPVKGRIALEQDGSFVYTPNENKKGRDYFGYKAIDAEGNVSQEATVIIRIEKQKKSVVYEDMEGRSGAFAAVELSECGVFTGEQIAGHYCFGPDKAVSRGEFLSMCMLVTGKPQIKGVMSTGYADDESIPYWMKEVVAAAVVQGMEQRRESFAADSPITKAEAVQMLNDALGLYDVDYIPLEAGFGDAAAQACINLKSVGILKNASVSAQTLTREEAAKMLVHAMETCGSR